MAERPRFPSVVSKMAGHSYLGSKLAPARQMYSAPEQQFACTSPYAAASKVAALARPTGFNDLCPVDLTGGKSLIKTNVSSPVLVPAANEKGPYGFAIDFLMGGLSAAVSKTAAAPIERVKLLIQNQDEMLKSGRLAEPYKGIGECFTRIIRDEGVIALWRGNVANVVRYFPTQVITTLLDALHLVQMA